jgi:hypothetical protein
MHNLVSSHQQYAIYDDIVNNFNICNLSNFKNYLTEELMINVIHIASAGALMGRTYVKFVTQLSPPTKHCWIDLHLDLVRGTKSTPLHPVRGCPP